MNRYNLTYHVESFRDGKALREKRTTVIELPSTVSEITLLQWVRYAELCKAAPEHVEREEGVNFLNWLQFVAFAKQVLEIFSNQDLTAAISGIPANPNAQNGIVAMYTGVVSLVAEYKPKERISFEWKDQTYVLPETVRQSFGQILEGGNLTVMEATDALQIEHVFSATNQDGTPAIEDAKYHNDIALVAALCRRVKRDGTLEMPPLDFIQRRLWFDRRIEVFSDLPMDIALDVAFFLIGSNSALKSILLSASRLNRSSIARQPERQPMQTNQSGRHGDGTPSSTR